MHWNIPSNSKWALDSRIYLLIHRVDDIRRISTSKKVAGIFYTRYPVPGITAWEGKLALSLSLSLRRGIALWTACFAKECLFLDQQRTRERKREERQPWRPPKCNGSWPSLLFVFFFPFSFLSIASFFWVLVCKCKHRHQFFFCRGLEEFSLLARIQLLRMTHYWSIMYALCLLPWNPSFLESRTQGIFEQMMCFLGFFFGKDCGTGILVFRVSGFSCVDLAIWV